MQSLTLGIRLVSGSGHANAFLNITPMRRGYSGYHGYMANSGLEDGFGLYRPGVLVYPQT